MLSYFPKTGPWAPKLIASQLQVGDTEFVAATFAIPGDGDKLIPLLLRPPVAIVVPVDSKHRRVMTTVQYRAPAGTHVREFVGAKIREGETPQAAAARKLRSEAGLAAKQLIPIDLLQNAVISGGYTNERCFAFFAEGLSKVPRGNDDLGVTPQWVGFEQVPSLIVQIAQSGGDAKLLAGLLALHRSYDLQYDATVPPPALPKLWEPRRLMRLELNTTKERRLVVEQWELRYGPWPWQQFTKPSVTLEGPPAVASLLHDDSTGHWAFVDQPRYPVRGWTREGVAGKIDPSETSPTGWEEPLASVMRETREEVGLEFPTWLRLAGGIWASPGYTNEVWHLFLGQGVPNEVKRRSADAYIHSLWHRRSGSFDPLLQTADHWPSPIDEPRLSDLKTVIMAWLFELLEESGRLGQLEPLALPRL